MYHSLCFAQSAERRSDPRGHRAPAENVGLRLGRPCPPWRSCTLPCLMHQVGKTAWASRVGGLHFGCCIRRCRCAPTPHIGWGVALVSCLLLVSDLCCSRAWGCPHFGPVAPVSHGVTGTFPRVGRLPLFPCGARARVADVILQPVSLLLCRCY